MVNDQSTQVPPELTRFNWAAFLWGGFWAIGHRVWIGLLAFVPLLGMIMNVVLGLRGSEWAWRAGAIPDIARFRQAQRTWVIVWAVLMALAVPVSGVFSALAIVGVRKYVTNAKRAEAVNSLRAMSTGMANCGAAGDLPATSEWVPSSLATVQGRKYLAAPGEWSSQPAFACAAFSLSTPQYFRYRWLQATNASGQFEAEADLDGDGTADQVLQQGVHCVSGACTVEPLLDSAPAK